MKSLFTTFVVIIFTVSITHAQRITTDWNTVPSMHKVKTLYANESAVILEDDRVHELRTDAKNLMYLYLYSRKLIKLNDDKGVEMYNKIYVFIPNNTEVLEIKARAIQPNGKIVMLPLDKIFDEEEDGNKYKKFALEGIEKGSEIEYIVRMKRELTLFGLEIYRSGKNPLEKARFELIVPEHLLFAVKGYNGIKTAIDTLIDKKRIITASGEFIEALDEDKYAAIEPYSANVQYKLAYNLDQDKNVRMHTWNELAKNVYANYYTLTDKELKSVEGFYKQMRLPDNLSEEARIIAIEDYMKSNINTAENSIGEDADKLERIIKTKVAGNYGFTRLLLGVFQTAGIKSQIVFPRQRDQLSFDEDFENYRLINDMVIYFPSTGKFLEPLNSSFRYPHIPPYYAGTQGLFLKSTTIGNFTTALAIFDSIPLLPYEENYHNLYADISINESMDSIKIKSKQSFLGYSATMYRSAFTFIPKDKLEEFSKDVLQVTGNADNITDIKVENSGITDGSKNIPLNIKGEISTAQLTEKAGNKIIIKIGEVIGTQVQMYQEKKRQLPVLIQYPHALDRTLKFQIPKGYQIKNLNDIKFNITDKNSSGIETMGFISTYALRGSELEIKINEFYKAIHYPVTQFEDFRKVVNAAADFNKIVLVLEKI